MAWEELGSTRHTCPCGNGEYEETTFSDDWGRMRRDYRMICRLCKGEYSWDDTDVRHHPGKETPRGWVKVRKKA